MKRGRKKKDIRRMEGAGKKDVEQIVVETGETEVPLISKKVSEKLIHRGLYIFYLITKQVLWKDALTQI